MGSEIFQVVGEALSVTLWRDQTGRGRRWCGGAKGRWPDHVGGVGAAAYQKEEGEIGQEEGVMLEW